jgi:hypothetical protein
MPGWDRFRINDNTAVLIANTPLAPNKKVDMLFKLDELDIDPEVSIGELEAAGADIVVGPFDDEPETFDPSVMPRVFMEDPGLPFPFKPMEMKLPSTPLNKLPSDFELDLDCKATGERKLTGEASLRSDSGTVASAFMPGMIGIMTMVVLSITEVGFRFKPHMIAIIFMLLILVPTVAFQANAQQSGMSGTTVSGLYVNSDAGLEIVFPQGWSGSEMPMDTFGYKIPIIPHVTGGSVQSNDKIEIKMHKSDETAGNPSVSGKALVLMPIGTSCVMNFDAEEEGLPLPFHLGSVLLLPAGDSTIKFEVECKPDAANCLAVFEHLWITVDGECTLDGMRVDGKAQDFLPITLLSRTEVDAIEKAGMSKVDLKELIELDIDCETEGVTVGELEGITVGDTDVAGPFD